MNQNDCAYQHWRNCMTKVLIKNLELKHFIEISSAKIRECQKTISSHWIQWETLQHSTDAEAANQAYQDWREATKYTQMTERQFTSRREEMLLELDECKRRAQAAEKTWLQSEVKVQSR